MTRTAVQRKPPRHHVPADAPVGVVDVMTLADGVVVRLAGTLGTDEAVLLREALLRPRPAACRDILVDAADVDGINDAALAVLVAAPAWATRTGGQLSFTRMSEPLVCAADGLGVQMPRLAPPGCRAR
jgi:anti-anti-sigma regulatory factor